MILKMHPMTHDLTGHKYGKLTVTKYKGRYKGRTLWQCTCKCGDTRTYNAGNIVGGHSTQCTKCAFKQNKNFQNGNKNRQVKITHKGRTRTIKQWAKITGLDPHLIHSRHARGCTTDQVFNKNRHINPSAISFTCNGKTHTIKEWALILGLTRQALHLRLNNPNWTQERALTTPKLPTNHPKRI